MRVFVEWIRHYGLPSRTSWLYALVSLLSQHSFWNGVDTIVLVAALAIDAVFLLHVPTTRTLVFAALLVFESVLLVTPWFYSWYVLWIIALAVLLLTEHNDDRNKIGILFAFVFSASAFFTYIMPYYIQSLNGWFGARYLLTDGPPVLILLGFLVMYRVRRNRHVNCYKDALP